MTNLQRLFPISRRAACVQGALWLGLILAASPAFAASLKATPIGTYSDPVYVVGNPANSRVLFVVERAGMIRVAVDEVKRALPLLDIRNVVRGRPDPQAGAEEGLLSVAFPPDYKTSRRFYVAYTNNAGNLQIDEFLLSAGNNLVADPASRRVVLLVYHPEAANHNGGQLQFGPDGFLYVSVGDGGRMPRGDLARNINSRLGKILRIIPLRSGSAPFTIPPGNPFVGKPGRDEVFAYGLRNPWRVSFDGNRLAIGDVGQSQREEVNFLNFSDAAGANFGWPQFEGELSFDPTRPGPHPPKPPMHVYSHDNGGCAITGGYVIRDPRLPALIGRYLYADYCTGDLRTFLPDVANQRALGDSSTGVSLPGLSSFGRSANGRLYAAQLNGRVSRLDPP